MSKNRRVLGTLAVAAVALGLALIPTTAHGAPSEPTVNFDHTLVYECDEGSTIARVTLEWSTEVEVGWLEIYWNQVEGHEWGWTPIELDGTNLTGSFDLVLGLGEPWLVRVTYDTALGTPEETRELVFSETFDRVGEACNPEGPAIDTGDRAVLSTTAWLALGGVGVLGAATLVALNRRRAADTV